MKKSIKLIIVFILGFVCCLSIMVSYASTFNSSEITYDTSTSGAVQSNVKAALDFLYNKTKSGATSECPENMSCVLKPGVTMNVSGPGTVNKGTVYVGLNESSTFTVTPDSGYVLGSISCTNGYTLSSFKTNQNASSKSECEIPQTITITNPGTTSGATCAITFASYDLSISSTNLHATYKSDTCNSANVGCVCYYIKNGGLNFTYGTHTGCNIKSTACKYSPYNGGSSFDCSSLYWGADVLWHGGSGGSAACSAVITCAT